MKRGFTLIELVVALGVIAIVTHLAVRELTKFGEAKLTKAADAQLEEVRSAAVAFLADTGRLVRAEDGTLSELWQMPTNLTAYAARSVKAGDKTVYVPSGWRGPYLKLPLGKSSLRDAWGNALEYRTGDEYERLSLSNGFAVAVSHYGPSALLKDRRKLSLLPEGGATSSVVMLVLKEDGVLDNPNIVAFGPDGKGGVVSATNTVSIGLQTKLTGSFTPGERVFVLRNGDTVLETRQITLRPGDNFVEFKMQ